MSWEQYLFFFLIVGLPMWCIFGLLTQIQYEFSMLNAYLRRYERMHMDVDTERREDDYA